MLNESCPRVSIILVNYKGVSDTVEAIRHLSYVNWPAAKLEIVVVDNNSQDESLEILSGLEEKILLVESDQNLGFAGGCNLGVEASSGEFVAFLNNDAKPHKNWISAAIAAFTKNPRVGAVASTVLDWEGKTIDFAGASLTWYGMGYKPLLGEPRTGVGASEAPVLFGTGAAMFVRRSVYDLLGGFDDKYFMFFEDVDFGWRLNLAGWVFQHVPGSIAYHKHHASMNKLGEFREKYLLERNALFTLYKNLGSDRLAHILPAAMALSARRSVTDAKLDSLDFEISRPGQVDENAMMSVDRSSIAGLYAVDQFVEALPRLREQRSKIQATRRVSDLALWSLFGDLDVPIQSSNAYRSGYETLVEVFPVLRKPDSVRILLITDEAKPEETWLWRLAEEISLLFEVVLLVTSPCIIQPANFRLIEVTGDLPAEIAKWENWARMIVARPRVIAQHDTLRYSRRKLAVDLTGDKLPLGREPASAIWGNMTGDALEEARRLVTMRSDLFLVDSKKQQELWSKELIDSGRQDLSSSGVNSGYDNLVLLATEELSEGLGRNRAEGYEPRNYTSGSFAHFAAVFQALLSAGSSPSAASDSFHEHEPVRRRRKPYGFLHNVSRAAQYLRLHGPRATVRRVARRVLNRH